MLTRILRWLLLGILLMPLMTNAQWVGFTKTVDAGFSWTVPAQGEVVLGDELADLIQNAQSTVDFCFYDLEFPAVVAALLDGHSAGVTVRVITDDAHFSNSAIPELTDAGIPVIDDAFGDLNSGGGEMHNKFAIIDQSIVWTGSYNVTTYGTYSNANNALWLENSDLAAAYTAEFDEMWGSNTLTPDPAAARFHGAKTDNTGHQFYHSDQSWRLYFAPSDGLTNQIIQAINTADYEIYISIFAFSTATVADAIHAKMQANPEFVVKGVFEETYWNTSWSMSLPMRGLGESGWDPPADVYKDSVRADLGLKRLHHKVMIIDGQHPGSNPMVITGSMNWSDNGENLNDENLLIIEDPNVVNLFVQEFAARLTEAGGELEFIPQGLIIEPAVVNFRNVLFGESAQASFTLRNLSVDGITIALGGFTSPDGVFAINDAYDDVLAPGDSVTLTAHFTPIYLGAHTALAPIYFDGEAEPSRFLTLQGRGVSEEPIPVVINEFMSNPDAVYDSAGEWLELYNPTGPPVKLNHWRLSDLDGDFHLIEADEALILAPGAFMVLANNGDFSNNGGVNVDYTWYGFYLANSVDEILLHNDLGEMVDSIAYGTGWPLSAGRAAALSDAGVDNALAANWYTASEGYGDGDKGTPGALNENQVGVAAESHPDDYSLAAPYPNPFNGSVILPLRPGKSAQIRVYNLLGQQVWETTLRVAQKHFNWTPQTLAGGIYFARIQQGADWRTHKLIYLK